MTNKVDKIIKLLLTIFALFLVCFHLYNYLTGGNSKTEFLLAGQMLLGIIVIYVPDIVKKIFKIEMSQVLKNLFWLFIFFAIFIGTGLGFYNIIFFWDKLLHLSSAILLTSVGFSLMASFFNKENIQDIKPLFFTLYAFMFAVAIGVFWEFWEFSFDSLLDMNMQRYHLPDGESFVGQQALYDTMSDLLCNTIGALGFALYGFIQIKKDKNWLLNTAFKITNKSDNKHE